MTVEEMRSAALGHAVAAYGPVQTDGTPVAEQQRQVIGLAILFQAYIQEGAGEAYKILGVAMPVAPVFTLVPKA